MIFTYRSLTPLRSRHAVRLLVLFAGLLTMATCRSDTNLGGGFYLSWMNGCEVRIVDRNPNSAPEIVIAGSVQSYAMNGRYIAGYSDLRCIDQKSEPQARPGYFLIDIQARRVLQSLGAVEWREALEKIGWKDPSLKQLHRTRG